jgi:hypothetical protein
MKWIMYYDTTNNRLKGYANDGCTTQQDANHLQSVAEDNKDLIYMEVEIRTRKAK